MYVWKKKKLYSNGVTRFVVKCGQLIRRTTEVSKTCVHWYFNAERSARRVRAIVEDLSMCNKFDFFVTLTFTSDTSIVLDRYDDTVTRKMFAKWRQFIKLKFPQLTYISVPEYHKKGGLHYHLVVGGVTASDLQLVYSKDVYCSAVGGDIPCYNVGAWKYGWSTATFIQGSDAVIRYVMKYITKGAPDPRFFRKHRFTCSHNLLRPLVFECNDEKAVFFNCNEYGESIARLPKYVDYSHGYYLYE